MKRIAIIFALIAPLLLSAQQPVMQKLGDWFSDTARIEGSLQGMAINSHYAVTLRHGGQCLILDLDAQKCVGSYQLAANRTHCNNASFSAQRLSPGDPFPLLYVSSCFGDKCCFVYRITADSSQLVQRIFFDSDCFPVAQDWCLDADSGYLYAFGGRRGGMMYLKRFRLPGIAVPEVHLTDSDVLATIPVSCVNVAQGSKIKDGRAYLPDGNEPGGYYLHILDLATAAEVRTIDLNNINCEPEGIDIADGHIYISFHTPDPKDNAIYRFPLRP